MLTGGTLTLLSNVIANLQLNGPGIPGYEDDRLGKVFEEIAGRLSLSVKTVGTYHSRLLEKMSMKSDVELTRYGLLNKLVD